jgi:FO synthase subunit 1
MEPEEVVRLVERAGVAGCSEALLTLGELPEVHPEVREKLDGLGYASTVDYLADLCKQILEKGLLPHTNAGLLNKRELRRLRRYNASMGLMLECYAELPVHRGSPGKNPERRLKMIETAGKLRIPFTTGLLIGIGESFEDRVRSLGVLRGLHERYGHIQEIIIQPFKPRPGISMEAHRGPSEAEVLEIVALARSLMPDVGVQVPPNLVTDIERFLMVGADDLGGISSITPDFINPECPWPSVGELRRSILAAGFEPRERLPIYPKFVKDHRFMSEEVRKVVAELADGDGYRAG